MNDMLTRAEKSLPQGSPVWASVAGAFVFAAMAVIIFSIREGESRSVEGYDIYHLSALSIIAGSALLGSAFFSECFLDRYLLFPSNSNTAAMTFKVLGGLNLLGRVVHLFTASTFSGECTTPSIPFTH